MNKTSLSIHPIHLNHQRIKDEGIVIFNGVRGLPNGNEPFFSPDYVICLCHRGHVNLMYDDHTDFMDQYMVSVIFPNHNIKEISKSDDYLATLIVVDATILNDPMLQIIRHLRYRYEPHPSVKLDKHEFKIINNVAEGMQETSRINISGKGKLMVRQLDFLLRLLSHYRVGKLNESPIYKRVSTQFQNNLELHFREHKNVDFYASLACLSKKHFSAVVKQETGHTASYCIHKFIITEASRLLHIRHDLPVQAVADMLGFDDQAAFSRYFKRETGVSPTKFREKD